MRLSTPGGLAYPITVSKLRCQVGDEIEQNASLFTYSYKARARDFNEETREEFEVMRNFYAEFNS